jgi:hypothetical protein
VGCLCQWSNGSALARERVLSVRWVKPEPAAALGAHVVSIAEPGDSGAGASCLDPTDEWGDSFWPVKSSVETESGPWPAVTLLSASSQEGLWGAYPMLSCSSMLQGRPTSDAQRHHGWEHGAVLLTCWARPSLTCRIGSTRSRSTTTSAADHRVVPLARRGLADT